MRHHLLPEMGRNDLEKLGATDRLFRKNTSSDSSRILKKGNEHPAWLPDGWNVGFKTRRSGVHKGARYKCFIDPLNRFKFYSKPEVLRYLETVDGSDFSFKKGCTAKQFTSNLSSAAKRKKLKHSAIKQQHLAGKEVSDGVLELSGACSSKEGQNTKMSAEFMVSPVLTSDSVVKMHLPKDSAENCSEINRSNPADVQEKNYFVSGVKADEESFVHTSISKNEKEFNVPHQNLRQLTGKADQLTSTGTHEPARRVSKRNFSKSVTPIDVDLKNKSSQKLNVVPEIQCVQKICGELLNKNSNSEVELVYRDQQYQQVTEKIDNKEIELKSSQDSNAQGLKVEVKNITCELPVKDVSHRDQSLAFEANVMKDNKLPIHQIGKSGASELHVNLNKYSNKEDLCNPCRRASKRLAGLEPEVTTNSIVCKRAPEYKSRRSKGRVNAVLRQTEGGLAVDLADDDNTYIKMPLNGGASNKNIKSPKIPLITRDQPEKYGNEETDYEKSEPRQSIASRYSRSDPCFEFAIKTLTGALPIEDSIGNGPNLAAEAMFDGAKESSSDRNVEVNSKKVKRKKMLTLPHRLSRRLAGHEPEVIPASRALGNATRKSRKDRSTATVALNNGISKLASAGKETELTLYASNSFLKSNVLGESSNRSEKSYEVQNFPKYQQRKRKTDRIGDKNLEAQVCLLFGMDAEHDSRASVSLQARVLEETLNKSEKPCETQMVEEVNECVKLFETQTIPTEQQQEPETMTSSETRLCLPLGKETECTLNASDSSETRLLKDTSNKSVKSYESHAIKELLYEDQTVANEQQQKLEAEKLGGVMSESQIRSTYEQFWSDPCLEFAIKTLTGTLPVDDSANVLPLTTPDGTDQADKELLDCAVKSPKEESRDNLDQSENNKPMMSNLFFQPPKQNQLRSSSTFCQNGLSYSDEADLTRNVVGEPPYVEDVNTVKLAHERITGNTAIQEELSKKIPQVLDVEAVSSEQPHVETEIMSREKPDTQYRYPFMESWSDPSLEFAFKTLAGAITIEEDLPIQGYLQETAMWNGQRDSYLSLPDFGSTSFSQSDISSYYNMEERSIPEGQPHTNLGMEVDPQKYHSRCNRKISM